MKKVITKMVVAGALMAGIAQAGAIPITPYEDYLGNTTWQDIMSVSYDLNDLDNDGFIDIGEQVDFDIVMHKKVWGTHRYDVLKVWIDDEVINAPVAPVGKDNGTVLHDAKYPFLWDYSGYGEGLVPDNADEKLFEFSYTFDVAKSYDIVSSVMCSRDLSALYGGVQTDWPTINDFNNWTKTMHQNNSSLQGETEWGSVAVHVNDVPEPGIISLIGCGILSLAFIRRKK